MDKTFDTASEPEIYAAWEAAGAFRAGANARPGAQPYCIMIPPPNVTGSLHMGHAFNNTLQDILIRWHRMRGFDVLWQPGTDHAGIATQMVVERALARQGKSRRDFTREEFLRLVWQQKRESRGNIIGQLKRLGASCDWSREAFTMSGAPGAPAGEEGNFHDAVLKVFVELYRAGCIYRGKRLVNWDPHFETAISDLEVEQVETDGHLWRLRYRLADGLSYDHPVDHDAEGRPTAHERRDYIVVATTRPETMLGDTAVAVHPDDPRYAGLIGRHVILPLIGRRIPIIADPHADPAKGTGAVKITPAHDFNDWEVGQRHGLPAINVMTTRAAMFLKGNTDFAEGCDPEGVARVIEAIDGADRYEARDWIVRMAEEEGWLDGVDPDRHMVPHGDRSKVAIEPYLTDQWFVDARRLAGPAIEAVRSGRTRILPAGHEKVYFHWMENIEPWCISRQLWWGHQIPVWYDEDGNPYCAMTEAEAREMAGGRALTRDPDVLDTWFSSALWPFGTLGWPERTPELARYYPGAALVTGFDILFFWVARMMMMGLHFMGEVPFRDVYVHALVRDEKGKKMSKSLGNVLDPLELIERYGADAVRFTLASMAAMGRDLRLSESRIAGYRNFVTKLWNAARFAEMNGARPVPGFDPATARDPLNRWIAGETNRARAMVDAALSAYRFNDAAGGLYAFVWGRVCDWYLELAKPLLAEDHPAREETRATLAWVIDRCLILLHPFMPFVTEALWGQIAPRPKMLIHADWPAEDFADPAADAEIGWVIALIEEIRSLRAELNVPPAAQVPLVVVEAGAEAAARLAANAALIGRLARVPEMIRADAPPRGAVTLTVSGAVLCLPLAGHVDLAAERARLAKAVTRLEREIAGLDAKLANPAFLSRAPEEVVEEQRRRLADARAEADRLRAALARVEAMA
ncbi:MAG: valine--tRNA ligase [Alphaproteobacteria bacterium]|nr:MAG: valine--tRNA ligase [Alphaproteobacteria bacterium]